MSDDDVSMCYCLYYHFALERAGGFVKVEHGHECVELPPADEQFHILVLFSLDFGTQGLHIKYLNISILAFECFYQEVKCPDQ